MTGPAHEILFEPFRLGSLRLRNRIVMAPMTRYFSPGGIPGEDVARYYRRRAEGEVGLIISEGTAIERPAAKNLPNVPDFHGELPLAGWRRVIDRVHEAGGAMGPQLWHVGSGQDENAANIPAEDIDSPSGIDGPGKPLGGPMSDEAIADTIAAFAGAAADARRLGFDVVEIHGAHGYLIDQFFWPGTNSRLDRYGGASPAERARFGAEVIREVRRAVGPGFPIIIRVSQWKRQDYNAKVAATPDEMSDWLNPLVEAGADVIHCSQRRFWEPEFPEIDGEEGLNLAGWAKKLTGAVTISVGSVGLSGDFMAALVDGEVSGTRDLARLVARMERGEFDLVAVGRALIADPRWPAKVRAGQFDAILGFDPACLKELA
jgi:2,4-dienoyl-CoA reductase-like NADH-dependent reductase (Old Yellow Enzyme family)